MAILSQEIEKIGFHYPMVRVGKVCIMPDHIHMIIRVSDRLPEGRHLGQVINGFKVGCNRAYRDIVGDRPGEGLFEEGYNDLILYNTDTLPAWEAYLDDNPRRLAEKRANPDLFKVVQGVDIGGMTCGMIGNMFLLDIPDKAAVIVHRRDSDAEYAACCRRWLAIGEAGGVLVSAAVAPREKAVMREAFLRGCRIIQLCENGFDRYYKPAGRTFDACAQGQLLQVSPWAYHTERRVITREQCLDLNALAEAIANGTVSRRAKR